MPRPESAHTIDRDPQTPAESASAPAPPPGLVCLQCASPLECVEQNRRAGTWVGSLMCPHCRSEYLYAYRWGRLLRRS
jgi:hypothetical protein